MVHPPQVTTPGLLLPPRSPALDDLRLLAAGCRACSAKGHVDQVLRARGVKAVDLRAAGVTVRFELEPVPTVLPATSGTRGMPREASPGGLPCGRADAMGETSEENTKPAVGEKLSATINRCLQLSVGCCVYQKGKYLLGHVERDAERLRPSLCLHAPAPPPPPPPPGPSLTMSLPFVREVPYEENGDTGSSEEDAGLSRLSGINGGPTTFSPNILRATTPESGHPSTLSATAAGGGGGTPRLSSMTGLGVGATDDWHWGGGPGPRPCKEALSVIQSLRVPLSDPHYFRMAGVSMHLGMANAAGGARVDGAQVLGGPEDGDEGWGGELLITRCAVLGNPRQPRSRADVMLSSITLEVRGFQGAPIHLN